MSAASASRQFCVDVFSPRPGAGNALAVVLGGQGLDASRMQAIAGWNNLAETTFLLPPTHAGADYRVRIFTTRQEIAFAGHPTIGSAHVARAAGLVPSDKSELVQQCGAGLLAVEVEAAPAGDTGAAVYSVRVPRSRIVARGAAAEILVDRALGGATRGDLRPACVEGGRRWWLAELADEAAVRAMKPDRAAILALARSNDSLGLCVFARSPHPDYQLVVRAFPLGVGIVEDPASGAANAAIAAFLEESGALGTLGDRFRVSQGREMGRDAELLLRIDGERQVWVGGRCRTLVEGSFDWQ
ncbi:MAG: PhzF family phenazine biosynthesis protein [Arenimonas sp.]